MNSSICFDHQTPFGSAADLLGLTMFLGGLYTETGKILIILVADMQKVILKQRFLARI